MKRIVRLLMIAAMLCVTGCASGPSGGGIKENADKAFDKLDAEQTKNTK
jgi:hypothetical protein